MFNLKKEMNESKSVLNKLKEYISTFRDELQSIYLPQYGSNYEDVGELYETLERCYNAFGSQPAHSNMFSIPNDLVVPKSTLDDPMSTLISGQEHLKNLYEYLVAFKINLENLPKLPSEPKKIIKNAPKQMSISKPLRIPKEMIICGDNIPSIDIICHPEPVTIVAESTKSIDKQLLGTDYVPFNLAIPSEHESTLLNRPSTSILPPISKTAFGMSLNETVGTKLSVEPTSKISTEFEGRIETNSIVQNIPEQEVSSIINAQHIEAVSEIQCMPNIINEHPVGEVVAVPELAGIDENAMEIMQVLSQLHTKGINRKLDSTSSNTTINHTNIISSSPLPLKKTKTREILHHLLLPHGEISENRIPPHFFDFNFNVHTQAVIDVLVKIRSTIQASSTPDNRIVPIQQNAADEIPTQHEALHLSQYQTEVQPLRSNRSHLEKSIDIPHISVPRDQQSEIQLLADEFNPLEQRSIQADVAQSSYKSPMPAIDSIVEPTTTDKKKQVDSSYPLFEDLLQKKIQKMRATPKKLELTLPATDGHAGRKSLRQMSELDMLKHLNHDQYNTLCVLRNVRRNNSSSSNQITIKSLRTHFGTDRIGFCKMIRNLIDLQCFDIIRIVKEGNEISKIEIFEN